MLGERLSRFEKSFECRFCFYCEVESIPLASSAEDPIDTDCRVISGFFSAVYATYVQEQVRSVLSCSPPQPCYLLESFITLLPLLLVLELSLSLINTQETYNRK